MRWQPQLEIRKSCLNTGPSPGCPSIRGSWRWHSSSSMCWRRTGINTQKVSVLRSLHRYWLLCISHLTTTLHLEDGSSPSSPSIARQVLIHFNHDWLHFHLTYIYLDDNTRFGRKREFMSDWHPTYTDCCFRSAISTVIVSLHFFTTLRFKLADVDYHRCVVFPRFNYLCSILLVATINAVRYFCS